MMCIYIYAPGPTTPLPTVVLAVVVGGGLLPLLPCGNGCGGGGW